MFHLYQWAIFFLNLICSDLIPKSVSCPTRKNFEDLVKMRGSALRSSRPANSMDQDSFDSFDDIEEMVMATNNLSLSPNGMASEANRDSLNVSGEEDLSLIHI